jgi:hypothetical protein
VNTLSTITETALHRALTPWDRIGQRLNLARYHLRQERICEGFLARLAQAGRRLDPADGRRAETYAAEVLGWRGYAPWLKLYTVVAGEFREGWIPDNYYSQVVIPRINGAYRHAAQLRQVAGRLFGAEMVPDSVHVVGGRFHAPDGSPIPPAQLAAHLFARGDGVVFKPNWSGSGTDIRIVRRESFDAGMAWPDGVFQHFVHAHPSLRHYQEGGTATLRLTTALGPDGRPQLRAAYIRFPRAGELYIAVKTVVRVMLNADTGDFAGQALLSDYTRCDRHPDSGIPFAGGRMPGFAAARERVLAMHAAFPFVGCIGWDIAVDAEERPWMLEWNAVHNGIRAPEAAQGPCFRGLGWENLWRQGQVRRDGTA